MIIDEEVYLEHYGVPGMKWGVRKSVKREARKDYDKARKATAKGNQSEYSRRRRQIRKKSQESAEYKQHSARAQKTYLLRSAGKAAAKGVLQGAAVGVAVNYTLNPGNANEKAIKFATKAGEVRRRMGESEVDKFIRNNAYDIASTPGRTLIDVFPRQGLSVR